MGLILPPAGEGVLSGREALENCAFVRLCFRLLRFPSLSGRLGPLLPRIAAAFRRYDAMTLCCCAVRPLRRRATGRRLMGRAYDTV